MIFQKFRYKQEGYGGRGSHYEECFIEDNNKRKFWSGKPSKIRTISFTGSYVKKCIRMLGKASTCSLHTILIDDVGPLYFGYLGLGKKR